jgi:TolB-like protein
MKNLYLLLLVSLLPLSLLAQPGNNQKDDVILKTNGEEMKGKVIKITDSDVTFIYTGETAEYILKKSEISKITHSSGRVELIGQPGLPAQTRQDDQVNMTASPADHHNKIAVLPFTYLMDNQPGAEAIGYKAQEDTYGFLSKNSAGYTILDPRTTNALLSKGGVTRDKVMNFTMKEICDILGVEYVIDGVVTQNKGYATSYTNGSSTSKVKRDDDKGIRGVSSTDYSSSNAAQRYDVSVALHIYMDNNASIYNQTHKAFLSNTDGSYTSPLEYLLKRCPLYRKN